MASNEDQKEEKEVLLSIYEGDDCFKCQSETCYQYRVGEDGHFKSFLLEISWGANYPDELPELSLGAFYNKHISPSVKQSIISKAQEEAEQWLGSAMTYTLFEWAKENAESLMENQTEEVISTVAEVVLEDLSSKEPSAGKPKQKKEQLTKAQKRKIANRTDFKGERERGWNWVDVIKLNKTANT